MANIEIGGRLHSTATGNVVTGANEVLDDTKNKKQSVINAEVDETIGDDNTAGTIKGRIKTAEGKLDTLNGDSSTSGSVAKAVADAKTELIGGATSNGNTLKKVEDRTATLETAVGSNGSVDQRIAAAKSEVIGDAASDYNTLGKLEDKIQAEASARESAVSTEAQARQDAITAETNRATTRENQIYDLVHTPEQHYVTVATYAELTSIASPSDDTVYRVSSYNGKTSQVDNTVYSEYGYNGTNFVFLCVKSQIDEVYDISAHHSNNTYVDLAAALDGGNNIPQELRKGGMSIKFIQGTVQSSDNKYVQFRCKTQTFSANPEDWYFEGDDTLVDNPEYLRAITDGAGHLLGWIRKEDGGIDWAVGVPKPVKEYVAAEIAKILNGSASTDIDGINKIIAFLDDFSTSDTLAALLATKVDKEEDKSLIPTQYIQEIENPEFIAAYLDNDDKILFAIKKNADIYFGYGCPEQIKNYVENYINIGGNSIRKYLDETFGKYIEDPEDRIEIKTDSDNKIISYRKPDGTLVENAGIETNHLVLTEEGMTDFQQALKDAGFQPGGGGDWSDKEVVEVPHPTRYAILNFHIGQLPKYNGEVKEGYVEYYDGLGNYFKKAVKVETQGQSSKEFTKTGTRGNYTLDIDDGSEIKFGSWVPQDSFHLKGTPKDVTHGILATSYKWAYMFMEYLDAKPNRVLLKDSSKITTTNASGDRFTDWIDDARCLPDGFPVEIYVEGEYWGLYALQLKKHRKNYSIKKSDYTSLFIDPDNLLDSDYQHGFWLDGVDSAPAGTTGKTWWNYFDIKGPKDLVCMDGSAFDGDNPKELIDNTSPVYDSSNKKHKGSAQAKAIIRGFSTKYLEVKELIDNNNIEGAKAKFNENFDYNACMLVYIYNCLMNNGDSIKKNTLWGTWKDGKIASMLWDIDGVYGTDWWGGTCNAPGAGMWTGRYATSAWPLSFMWTLYQDKIKTTYAELRSHGIIDMNTWKSIVFGWANQIGTEAFDRDIERWPEMPSYRENYTNTEYWQEYGSSSAYSTYPAWDENTSYSVGDIVVIKIHPSVNWYLRYRAVKASDAQNPQPPVTKLYDACPQVGGYYDSPRRMEKWMEEQIRLCDIQNDYFAELVADFIAYRSSDEGCEIECTNMTVDTKLSKNYNYIQGHITRHEIEVEGQTVSTYTIDNGIEAPEDTSKTYTTVKAAIETAASQPVDIPSENVYYIKARAKDINYHKK